MKICIAGPGAIGVFLASKLISYNQVFLLHHDKAKADSLASTGFVVKENNFPKHFSIPVTHIVSDNIDIMIVAFKSYSFDNCSRAFLASKPDRVLSIQNGLGNCEKLAEIFPSSKIFAGCTSYGVSRDKPNSIEIRGQGEIRVGAFFGTNDASKITNTLQHSGINSNPYDDIKKQLWLKVGVNACINPVASIFNCENGKLLENEEAQRIWRDISKEISRAAAQEDVLVTADEILANATKTAQVTSGNICSMLHDIRAGRKTEIDSICGIISKKLHEKGFSSPVCDELLKDVGNL